jgi:hypothetical protein
MIYKPLFRAIVFALVNAILVFAWVGLYNSPVYYLTWVCIILHILALINVDWIKVFNK